MSPLPPPPFSISPLRHFPLLYYAPLKTSDTLPQAGRPRKSRVASCSTVLRNHPPRRAPRHRARRWFCPLTAGSKSQKALISCLKVKKH